MNIERNYIIMEPLKLDWTKVSPAHFTALDYHLTEDLFIRFEGLHVLTATNVKGEEKKIHEKEDFLVGLHCLVASEHDLQSGDTSPAELEHKFNTEIMPLKTWERINKAFSKRGPEISCFFGEREMRYFENEFEEQFINCSSLTIHKKNGKVDDIAQLGKEDYKIVMDLFELMHVQATVDMKQSKEELEAEYKECFEKNAGMKELVEEKKIWDQFKSGPSVKNMIGSALCTVASVGAWILKRRFVRGFGWKTGLLSAISGIASIGFNILSVKLARKAANSN